MQNNNILTPAQYVEEKEKILKTGDLVETGLYTANLLYIAGEAGSYALQDTVQLMEMTSVGDRFDLAFKSHINGVIRFGRIASGGIIAGANTDGSNGFSEGYFKAPEDDVDFELWDICEKEEEQWEPVYAPVRRSQSMQRFEQPM